MGSLKETVLSKGQSSSCFSWKQFCVVASTENVSNMLSAAKMLQRAYKSVAAFFFVIAMAGNPS